MSHFPQNQEHLLSAADIICYFAIRLDQDQAPEANPEGWGSWGLLEPPPCSPIFKYPKKMK